jgi:hypothetical protein
MKKKIMIASFFAIQMLIVPLSSVLGTPSIESNIEKVTSYNDLVLITVQFCKTDGVENQKIFITKELNEKLDIFIEKFKQDLESSESYEETVRIYNDMVESLDKIGLLPSGMSLTEIQRLITGKSYRFSKFFSSLQYLFKSRVRNNKEFQKQSKGNVYDNVNCLISSRASHTYSRNEGTLFERVINFLLHFFTPFYLANVYYGKIHYPTHGYPAVGWIRTDRETEKWTYEGKFHGGMGDHQIFMHPLEGSYRGVKKFFGLIIGYTFYLGRAEHVIINGWDP